MAAATVDVALAVTGLNASLGALQAFNRALGGVGRGVGAAVSAVGSALVGIGTAGAVALGGIGAVIGKTGVDFLAMKEQAQTAFTTLLGDGGKATAFLAQLQTLAASTPFEFPDLVTGAQRLLAMGFAVKDVIPALTAIGDAVAAMGGGKEQIDRVTLAFGQMQAKGRVQGDEMLQLAEAGIPAWKYLAQTLGVDIPTAMKMVTKGQVSSAVGIAAITKGMQADFGGAMAAQSKTWKGLISSAKDYARIMAGTAMGPVFTRVLKPALEVVAAFMAGPGQKAAERFAAALDRGITRALHAWRDFRNGLSGGVASLARMGGAVSIFQRLGQEVRNFLGQLRGTGGGGIGGTLALALQLIGDTLRNRVIPAVQLLWNTFRPLTGGEGASGLQRVQDIIMGVAGVVERVARWFQLAVDAVVTFKQALSGDWFPNGSGSTFVNIVGDIGLALGKVPDTIATIRTRFDELTAAARKYADMLPTLPSIPAPVVAGAAGAGALAVANPGAALAVGKLGLGALGQAATFAISILGGLVAILGGPVTLAIGAVALAGFLLYEAWVNNWGGIRDTVVPIVQTIATWFTGTLIPAVTALALQVGTFLTPYVLALGGAIQAAIVNATPGVTAFFMALQAFAAAAWPVIQQVATVIVASLGPAIAALFTWATTVIPQVGQVIGEVFQGLGAIVGFFAQLWSDNHNLIVAVFTGAWQFIAGTIQIFWGLFSGVISMGLDLLTGNWQQFWLDWANLFTTVWDGFQTAVGGAWSALVALFSLNILALMQLFTDVLPGWQAIGTAIVEGIKTGITSAWEGLKTLLSGLANGLPGPVKAALGINSPSKVFADTVGAQIPAGIAAGITGNAGVIDGALAGLVGVGAAGAVAAGGLGALGAGGGGRIVTVNATFNVNGLMATEAIGVVTNGVYGALASALGEGPAPAMGGGGGGGLR